MKNKIIILGLIVMAFAVPRAVWAQDIFEQVILDAAAAAGTARDIATNPDNWTKESSRLVVYKMTSDAHDRLMEVVNTDYARTGNNYANIVVATSNIGTITLKAEDSFQLQDILIQVQIMSILDDVVFPNFTEICSGGIDEDGDGLVDCADPDCAGDPACPTEICGDGIDNDGDGLIDCDDQDCIDDQRNFECSCEDLMDNDWDGYVDCYDPDCAGNPACIIHDPTDEDCDDGVDNDFDGLTDCADPDCAADPACIS